MLTVVKLHPYANGFQHCSSAGTRIRTWPLYRLVASSSAWVAFAMGLGVGFGMGLGMEFCVGFSIGFGKGFGKGFSMGFCL